MRTLAVSLLVLAAVVYVSTLRRDGVLGFVNAGAEAAMVGAVADWFAVTAIFRHPLGLPIPHTALIPKRKDALGLSLQEFVADNFLAEDVVRERVASAQVSRRIADWLVVSEHSQQVVDLGSRVLRDAVSRVKDDDVAALVSEALIPRLIAEPLSPAAGQMLQEVLRDGAHHGLVDIALDELHRWLVENEETVIQLVAERAPWWTPQWLDEKVTERVHREAVDWVADVRKNPKHSIRLSLDAYLTQLAQDLQHDPATRERAEQLKERILTQPQVVDTAISIWNALRRGLVDSLGDADGLLRRRAVEELDAFARRVAGEPTLQAQLDGYLGDAAAFAVNNYGTEIATVISETVNRWDGKEAAARIELHVGRDLQFIRINGTVVGAIAGLLIHAFALTV